MATKKKKNPYEDYGLQEAGYSSGDQEFTSDNPYEEYGLSQIKRERDPNVVWDWNKPSKQDVAQAVVDAKKKEEEKQKPEERKRSIWEKIGDKFEANSPEDKAKREAEGKPTLYKDEPTKGYSSIGNRIGDIFEANSPQDKAKRIAAGEQESYQYQQALEKEAKTRNEKLNYTKEEVNARRDYFNRQGVDIDKALDLRNRYADIFKSVDEVKGKGIDWKKLAEQAKSEGLFEGRDDAIKDFDAALQFEKQGSENASRTFFRQSVGKALDNYDTKKLQKIESEFSNYTASKGKEALPQQINRNFQRGLIESIVKFPGSARTMGAGALDLITPEGSRVDKFAQGQYEAGKQNLKDVDQQLVDQGVGTNPNDNRFVGNVSAGAGSLASSLFLGGLGNGDKVSEATGWLAKARSALNPGVPGAVFGTNAGADQYIGAIDAGKADWQAFGTAIVGGAAEGYLEKLGVDKFLGAEGTVVKKFITRSLSEGIQEASQSLSQAGVKSTYTSVDFSDALMQALEEGGYGAIVGGGASISMSLAENMIAKGVPEDVAKDTADKVAKKLDAVAQEELPEPTGDDIIQQLQGDEGGQPTDVLPTDGDEIVKALQDETGGVPVEGQPTDVLPTNGDEIVKALQDEGGQPIPDSGDAIVKELQDDKFSGNKNVEMVSVDELKKFAEFDRGKSPLMSKEKYEELKADIQKNGIKEPLILTYGAKDRIASIGEGNHRLAIAIELGIKDVPVEVTGTQLRKADQITDGKGFAEVTGREPDETGYVPSNQKPSDIGVGRTATKPVEAPPKKNSNPSFELDKNPQFNQMAEEARKAKSFEDFANGVYEVPIKDLHGNVPEVANTPGLSRTPNKPVEIYIRQGRPIIDVTDGNHRLYEAKARGDKTIKVRFNDTTKAGGAVWGNLKDFYDEANQPVTPAKKKGAMKPLGTDKKEPEHITRGKAEAKSMTEATVKVQIAKQLRAYIERNDSPEKFAQDIHTQGGTFGNFSGSYNAGSGYLIPGDKKSMVKSGEIGVALEDGRTFRFKAADIYNAGKAPAQNTAPAKKKGAVKSLKKKDGVFPEKVEAEAMRLHNKPANKLSVTQLKSIVADTKATVTGGIELVQKLGSYRKGIAVDDTRPALVYGGYNKGVYTDGYVLYNEPQFAKKIYEGIFANEESKFVRLVMKADPKASRAEAEEAAKEATKKNIESNESRFPDIEKVPTIQNNLVGLNGAKAEVKGYYENFVVLESSEGYVVLNTDLLAFADKQYPNATYRVQADPLAPVQILNGNKIVGIIMPLKRGKENNVPAELLSTTPKKSSSTGGGNNALFNPDSRMNSLMDKNSKSEKIHGSTRSVEDLIKLAQDLNKAGQANAMLRRGGSKSKKALGSFQSGGRLKGKERIMLQDAVINDPAQYVSTLAHELSHASEFQINGNTSSTYKLFGEITDAEKKQIGEELKAIVLWLEGDAVIQSDPTYYNRPTEQLARYVQVRFLDKAQAVELAPLLTEKYDQAVERHPELKNLIDALEGELDKGFRNKIPNWYRDLRQTYQKHLGKRAGDNAYNAELVRRARIQNWRGEVGELIKRKFKGIKDDTGDLFRTAEAIKQTDENGELVYGTRDIQIAENPQEVKDLQKAGYEYVKTKISKDGDEQLVMAKQRYTEEEGKAMFEALTPEGQKLVRDFVANRKDAKDFFNREVIKDVFKIDSELEGWVHRGLREEAGIVERVKGRMSLGGKKTSLREKKAGAKKQRGASETYLADFQKQMEKALLELGDAEINNQFIVKQLARISKPIAKGKMPDVGWVEVTADFKKGLMLPGEGGRQTMSAIKTDFDFDNETETTKLVQWLKPQARYQVPANLAKHYREIRMIPEEMSRAKKIMMAVNKYWAINVLLHGGTVGTNFIGGGIQYSAKIMNDFYAEILTGNVAMPQTRRNVAAMLQVLLPHGWSNAPDYVYGGHRSNYAGQFMNQSKTETFIDKAGDIGLTPFSLVESYWKKAILISEQGHKMDKKKLETELIEFTKEEEKMIAQVNEAVDLYAFDYDNVPAWIESWGRGGGGLIKPFMKYPYKYSKMITNLATGAFDKTLPANERAAKILTLGTMMAISLALMGWRDEEKETPDGTEKTPSSLNPRGRLFGWAEDGKELFVRTAKYPFINIASTGKALVQGDFEEASNVVTDQLGSIGPAAQMILTGLGYTNKYQQYTPKDAMIGQQAASFIPGFRILNDIGKLMDSKSRRPENFIQGIGSTLPIWGSEETKQKYRGDVRTVKIPDEPAERSIAGTSTNEREIILNNADIIISALTGIYITRIDPEEAKQQALREQRNSAEQTIRALLSDGKESEAETKAKEVGLTIPKGTYDYYRRKRSN